jgi:hypothetical protein
MVLRRWASFTALALLLPATAAGQGGGLPEWQAINPLATSRSGLYFQPYREPHKGFAFSLALDYASTAEVSLGRTKSDTTELLDTELMRFTVGLRHDLGTSWYVAARIGVGGSYDGFMDGFLDWYHGLFGISFPERDKRPHNQFAYYIKPYPGFRKTRQVDGFYLGDTRVSGGHRFSRNWQTEFSITLPTATAPEGYGTGVMTLGLMTDARYRLSGRWTYEGSVGVGYSPAHGDLAQWQNELTALVSSGIRWRFAGSSSLYTNFILQTPYYHDAFVHPMQEVDFDLDFGYILRSKGGREFRLGMTEDLYPPGPAIDLIFRFGYSW